MNRNTITNPGCYHSMIHYLSSISNISPYKEMNYYTIERAKPLTHNVHFILNGEDLGQLRIRYRKGGIQVLTNASNSIDYDINTKFDRIYKTILRDKDEFGIQITKLSTKYKDSLGNGWYSYVDLYQVNDQYFAMMDCTC